jgi:hypothetical protein
VLYKASIQEKRRKRRGEERGGEGRGGEGRREGHGCGVCPEL